MSEFYYYDSFNRPIIDRGTETRGKEGLLEGQYLIRELNPGDILAIHEIFRLNIIGASKNESYLEGEYEEVEGYLRQVQEYLSGESNRHYVVCEGATEMGEKKTLGILAFSEDSDRLREELQRGIEQSIDFDPDEQIAELHNFYVHPNYQHNGIGSKMWERIEGLMDESKIQQRGFSSRFYRNRAWNFYQRQGYEIVKEGLYRGVFPCSFFYKKVYFDPN